MLYDIQSIGAQAYMAVANESYWRGRVKPQRSPVPALPRAGRRRERGRPASAREGFEALISTAKAQREQRAEDQGTAGTGEVATVRIADVAPNHFQPRRSVQRGKSSPSCKLPCATMAPAADHCSRKGGGGWELVAGERRLRAATRLGWTEIPALVRDFDDRAMLTRAWPKPAARGPPRHRGG